jgi:hypothetical protein
MSRIYLPAVSATGVNGLSLVNGRLRLTVVGQNYDVQFPVPEVPTALDLNAPFTPAQLGKDALVWLDGSDASQLTFEGEKLTQIASKGNIPLQMQLLGGTAGYDAGKQAFLLTTGNFQANAQIPLDGVTVFMVYKDSYNNGSGVFQLQGPDTGIWATRQPYGSNASELQINTSNSGNTLFIEIIRDGLNILTVGSDKTRVVARIEGNEVGNSVIPMAAGPVTFTLQPPGVGVYEVYQVLILPNYYEYLSELLEGYYAWLTGLQGSLPDGHTFKNQAPVVGDYYDALSGPDAGPGDTNHFTLPIYT